MMPATAKAKAKLEAGTSSSLRTESRQRRILKLVLQCMLGLVPYQSGAWADGDEDGVPLDGAEDSEGVGVVEAWQERTQEVLDPGAHEFNRGS